MKIHLLGAKELPADRRTDGERDTVEPWIASIIRSRNVLVIQNTRISK